MECFMERLLLGKEEWGRVKKEAKNGSACFTGLTRGVLAGGCVDAKKYCTMTSETTSTSMEIRASRCRGVYWVWLGWQQWRKDSARYPGKLFILKDSWQRKRRKSLDSWLSTDKNWLGRGTFRSEWCCERESRMNTLSNLSLRHRSVRPYDRVELWLAASWQDAEFRVLL